MSSSLIKEWKVCYIADYLLFLLFFYIFLYV